MPEFPLWNPTGAPFPAKLRPSMPEVFALREAEDEEHTGIVKSCCEGQRLGGKMRKGTWYDMMRSFQSETQRFLDFLLNILDHIRFLELINTYQYWHCRPPRNIELKNNVEMKQQMPTKSCFEWMTFDGIFCSRNRFTSMESYSFPKGSQGWCKHSETRGFRLYPIQGVNMETQEATLI